MKKLLICVFSIAVLLFTTIACYAGDIPETLLFCDSCQVYFGEVKSIEDDTITVIQKQNIKGDFLENREITYQEFAFTISPEIGETYLCGYFDENNPLYIWEVTSLEPKTLKIENTDDMSKRMQEYLNDGKFEEKEAERLSEIKSNSDVESNTMNQDDDGVPFDKTAFAILIFSGIILIGIVVFIWRKRKK